MGYLDTLKKLNKPTQKKSISLKPSVDNDDEYDRAKLMKLARSNIDPLDIKTNLLPDDYQPVIPKHIIKRNLERKAKNTNKRDSSLKNSGNSSMNNVESSIIKQRLISKYKSKNTGKAAPVIEQKPAVPEKKMSFKEMMKLAEGTKKPAPKPVEKKVTKEPANKVDKKNRFLNREKINEQKRLEAFKKQEKLLSKSKPKKEKTPEEEYKHTSTGFDMLMEEELEAEEIARREDIKEAKLLKKRAMEKQKMKSRP